MKKLVVLLLALSLVFSLVSCFGPAECTEHVDSDENGKCDVCNETIKSEPCTEHVDADENGKCDECGETVEPEDDGVMTYAEFVAAKINDEVTVITYVQAKQSWWEKNGVGVGTFYTQAEDGAYYLYEMPCSKAEFDALVPGTCIKVNGFKAEWSGEVEIVDATFEIIADAAPFIATAKDITDAVASGADISADQNKLIGITNAIVKAPAIYNWDGSGSEGNDLYLAVTVGGKELTVVVESYLHGNGSEVYEAVEALEAGDVISLEAFLYWYNGAQPHVNAIEKVDTSYAKFAAAEINSEVTVITYVQAKQSWWEKNGVGVGTFYTQAQDGAYFLYEMPCSKAEFDALVPGTCILVNGFKAEWSGEVEIIDATFEILEGAQTYIAEALDVTADIAAGTDIIEKQNQLIAINNATVKAPALYKWNGTGAEGDDLYLTLTVGEVDITVVVESYLHGNGSEVYEAVEALKAGDVVSVEAFLYWYSGAQPHVNAITVAE